MSTFMAQADKVERKWYVIDAAGVPLGKTAVKLPTFFAASTDPNSLRMLTAANSSSSSIPIRLFSPARSWNRRFIIIIPAISAV